ncbi:MAG: hypothetical protein P8M02_09235 [Flavobacteriaceae bacterium]|nr:hypothetical protein [Flavobacteriaceae bacterium]
MRVNRFFEGLFFVLLFASEFVWSQTNYSLDVSLKVAEETLQVSQTIEYVNAENKALNTLYLYDWANSYQGAPAPLANHLANEFNRSFYISSNSKLGYSQMGILGASNISSWSRLADQLDIIKINLDKELEPGDTLKIDLKYLVKIPDDKFTGVGINSSKGILLRDLFISVAPRYDGEWLLNSNLGFRDYSGTPSNYEFNWEYPTTYTLLSNLSEKSSQSKSSTNTKTSRFIDKNISSPEFVFDLKDSFKTIKISENFSIVTDILPNKNTDVDFEASLQRIDAFTKKILKPLPNKKLLVLKKDYARNPLVGISQALAFLNPFPDDFIFETRFIKAYLASYLNELFTINKRKEHWITGGIQTYVMIKYVDAFYPDSKFLGDLYKFKILGVRPFNSYSAAKIGFNESYSFIAEFGEHANRQQQDTLGKERLTKSNELYTIPYHVGSGLIYLDSYLGDDVLVKAIKTFSETRGTVSLNQVLKEKTNKNVQWFFDTYLTDREAYDLSIKNVIKGKNEIRLTVSEENSKPVPFKLDLIQDDKIISEQWIHHSGKDTILQLKSLDADFVAINSNRFLPEKNRPNNWKYLKSSSGFKPLQLTFYGDGENLKRNQLFYHPISDFNAYDGFTGGMRIYNTRVKNQPFEIDLHPQYSFKEQSFVGFFRTRYRFINHKSKNYLNQVFLTGKSYHYNTNLRYTSLQPSFSMYFRPFDLRSNKRQLFNISWYNVFRDRDPNIQTAPDYSVLSLLHRYNNSDAVNVFSTNSNFEASNKFGKIYFSSNYRKLFPSGRQFAIRFFAGKFLWHNTKETQYFDFNLNRSPDYLFRYDYLGRSEDTGIYSQQFVPAEGGFKAFFDQSSANDYMASINASIGLWKWIEFYGDVGILRNKSLSAVTYFDSGFKFSLVPDYFEIFFPLYSSNGFEPTQSRYATKIRFIFTPRLSTLSSLFTRKWF